MLSQEKILKRAKEKGRITSADFAKDFDVSRQYASQLIKELVDSDKLKKMGSTRGAFYVLPEYFDAHPELLPSRFSKTYRNEGLEEHIVLEELEKNFTALQKIAEPVRDIFIYAFSEMFNNAIEHSQSKKILVEAFLQDDDLCFVINDGGVGVYRNIMRKKKLRSPFEAIQDLLKGKTTTQPKSHSGEGIFFTSKAADTLVLDSFGYQMTVDNTIPDVFIRSDVRNNPGTRVTFRIQKDSDRHLSRVFKKYTDHASGSDYGFDKTEIHVKLYTRGSVHISRSQARRILHGLDLFKVILLDYANVPMVGQAFTDEIYRVFHSRHPRIELQEANMNEAVAFMVTRAKTESRKGK
ncbi:MAG: DUF4325 domain-containing protein [bacterium]|nr:DUF4325 domain-containing protein [bacterium]